MRQTAAAEAVGAHQPWRAHQGLQLPVCSAQPGHLPAPAGHGAAESARAAQSTADCPSCRQLGVLGFCLVPDGRLQDAQP
jgi:hypothetical protein